MFKHKDSSKNTKLIIITIFFLLFVFLIPEFFFKPIRGALLRIAGPFQKISYVSSNKIKNFFTLITSISDLKKENEKLFKENSILSAELANLKDQKKENEILRNQLNLSPRDKYDLETALVIGKDPLGSGSWLIIDKGSSHGIETGMPVTVFNGILIGKTGDVYHKSSKIILLTDSSSSINVTDLNSGAKGILTGEYNIGLLMTMVEQADVLNLGDEVITSGLGGSAPKGLLIGNIQKIDNTEDKLFQQAAVIPKIKYSDLISVSVIKENFSIQ